MGLSGTLATRLARSSCIPSVRECIMLLRLATLGNTISYAFLLLSTITLASFVPPVSFCHADLRRLGRFVSSQGSGVEKKG